MSSSSTLNSILAALAIAHLTPHAVVRAAEKPLNVLFIAGDDKTNDLGRYGHTQAKSPNLDRLAARGVRFDRAYCQFPLCSPSRSSLLTGLRPDTTRVFNLQYHFRTHMNDVVTLPQLFKNNGYYVARVGKIYHYGNPGDIGTNGLDDEPSWTERFNPAGVDKREEPIIKNYSPSRGLGSAMCFLASDAADEEHTDGMVATHAIKLIEDHHDQPFFIAAGFYRPHTPYVAPKKYFDLYPLDEIRLPEQPSAHLASVPPLALASTSPAYFGATVDQARECKQAYYASISFVDANIGRLLDCMDRLNLWENTAVVFWSDHGYHLGEHGGLWMKQSLFEESARVPMIVAAPNMPGAGHASERTVEFLDIYPTLADLAGLKAPSNLAGASLRPLLEDPTAAWNRPAYTQVMRGNVPGHSVRTERWRYIEWGNGREGAQLYDHDADPQELVNLSGDSKYAKEEAELKALVRKNWPDDAWSNHSGKNGGEKKVNKKGKRAKAKSA